MAIVGAHGSVMAVLPPNVSWSAATLSSTGEWDSSSVQAVTSGQDEGSDSVDGGPGDTGGPGLLPELHPGGVQPAAGHPLDGGELPQAVPPVEATRAMEQDCRLHPYRPVPAI